MKSKTITYNMNCIDYMKNVENKKYDLAIVDPPYGLGKRLSEGGGKLKDTPFAKLYKDKNWDNKTPSKEYFDELFRISKNQIIFGANYFINYLHNTRCILCWDKNQNMPTLSAIEIIWTSFDKPSKIYKKVSTDKNRFHPTQKPIALYDWIIKNYAKDCKNIIDTHLGSGSSRIAAYKANIDFVGIELDSDYYELQEKRFNNYIKQTNLFKEIE